MGVMDHLARTPKQIGAVIARLRREQNLTQAELAAKVSLRQEGISKIEAGNAATRLSKILDVIAALDLELVIRPRSKSSPSDFEDIF